MNRIDVIEPLGVRAHAKAKHRALGLLAFSKHYADGGSFWSPQAYWRSLSNPHSHLIDAHVRDFYDRHERLRNVYTLKRLQGRVP